MLNKAKKVIRSTFKVFGYELVDLHQRPTNTFLGLGKTPIKTIIDVGANRGQFCEYISAFFPDALIHAFEPLPGPGSALEKWGQKHNKRLVVHRTAVGSERGTTKMQHHIDFTPSSSVLENAETINSVEWQKTRIEEIDVEVTTLDDEFPEGGKDLEKPILLKLDVQGFEDRVISGAKNLISECDIIVVEHCAEQLYKGQAGFDDIYQGIKSAGLEYVGNLCQHHANDGSVVFADIVFTNPSRKAA